MRTGPAVAFLLVTAACGSGPTVYRASGAAPRSGAEGLEARIEARARELGYKVSAPADVSRSGAFVYAQRGRDCGRLVIRCRRQDLLIIHSREVPPSALGSRWEVDVWAWTVERSGSVADYGAVAATPEVKADADAMLIAFAAP
jgi:hypothetical protein